MDGNFNNNQNVEQTTQQNNYYQDYTSAPTPAAPQSAPQNNGTSGVAVVSLVMGIISIVFSCCYGAGVIFGIVGIICAVVGKKNGKSGILTAGLICSIIGTVLSVLVLIYFIWAVGYVMTNPEMLKMLEYYGY
uniref:hypothetical protein n=1 Tax=Acetatifactor sp. TaxID=1872090 RepID=UPI004056D9B7